MMDHLKPEEIVQMPLHMQILYYFEKWGVSAQGAELTKKAGWKTSEIIVGYYYRKAVNKTVFFCYSRIIAKQVEKKKRLK